MSLLDQKHISVPGYVISIVNCHSKCVQLAAIYRLLSQLHRASYTHTQCRICESFALKQCEMGFATAGRIQVPLLVNPAFEKQLVANPAFEKQLPNASSRAW